MAVNWNRRKYTKEEFTEAWLASASIFEVGRRLGVKATGGGHLALKQAAEDLGLDSAHMTGKGWAYKRTLGPSKDAMPLADVLVVQAATDIGSIRTKRVYTEFAVCA